MVLLFYDLNTVLCLSDTNGVVSLAYNFTQYVQVVGMSIQIEM